MSKPIEYFFWMNSDWAYLGADRLEELAHRQRVRIHYKPVDLPNVYSRTGGVLLSQRAPERQAYRIAELDRWCKKLGIEVNATPKFMCPNADLASKVVIAAIQRGKNVLSLYKAILRAEWCEDRDISSESTLAEVLRSEGLENEDLLRSAGDPEIDVIYRRNTDDAVKAGVFGSPSYVFDGELFWGQDRLEMLEETVARKLQEH